MVQLGPDPIVFHPSTGFRISSNVGLGSKPGEIWGHHTQLPMPTLGGAGHLAHCCNLRNPSRRSRSDPVSAVSPNASSTTNVIPSISNWQNSLSRSHERKFGRLAFDNQGFAPAPYRHRVSLVVDFRPRTPTRARSGSLISYTVTLLS